MILNLTFPGLMETQLELQSETESKQDSSQTSRLQAITEPPPLAFMFLEDCRGP